MTKLMKMYIFDIWTLMNMRAIFFGCDIADIVNLNEIYKNWVQNGLGPSNVDELCRANRREKGNETLKRGYVAGGMRQRRAGVVIEKIERRGGP